MKKTFVKKTLICMTALMLTTVSCSEVKGNTPIIIEEENFAYFAGEQSIDTAIENIQKRASIWISEQS